MSHTNGKALRFAALVRVSTERQASKGESLRTQTDQINGAVTLLGGTLARTYAGQEHGTEGWERKQLDQLMADATRPAHPFDAVIVADPTRWSRDNIDSDTKLGQLRDARVRFFVLASEYDLNDPEKRMFLRMSATFGAYHADKQRTNSTTNKIKRALRGFPACGLPPFGRTCEAVQTPEGLAPRWAIDPAKQEVITDLAARYLKGESLTRLAGEYNLNYSTLCLTLRDRCGEDWYQEFDCRRIKLDLPGVRPDERGFVVAHTRVPRLLDEQTIRAVRQRLDANRKYLHGTPHSDYLLSGHVFCAHCGYSMHGADHGGFVYYRHGRRDGAKDCPLRPRPQVRADALERSVVRDLFEMFGNRGAIERAVKAAVPDHDKLLKQKARVEAQLAKVARDRTRYLNMMDKDLLTQEQAEERLLPLKQQEAGLRSELDGLDAQLADVPDADGEIFGRVYVEEAEKPGDPILVYDDAGQFHPWMGNDLAGFLTMCWSSRGVKDLVACAFGTLRPGQPPPGVYVTPAGGRKNGPKSFSYELRGNLSWRVTQTVSS
jgi:DNA invertase Pin-like site-specific DNA recombinase